MIQADPVMTEQSKDPATVLCPHNQAEVVRLSKIQMLVTELSSLLQHGETIELWNKSGFAHCKVGFEELEAMPVRSIAEVAYMLAAVKAVNQAEANKEGVLSDQDYFAAERIRTGFSFE